MLFDQTTPIGQRPLDIVRKKYPNAVESVVAAFGISHVYYKEEWGVDQIATLKYTKIPDQGSIIGVKLKLEFHESSSSH